MHACMYVCIYAGTNVSVNVHLCRCVHAFMYVCLCTNNLCPDMCVCMYVCMYICVCLCMYVYMYVYIVMYMFVYVCIYVPYICIITCILLSNQHTTLQHTPRTKRLYCNKRGRMLMTTVNTIFLLAINICHYLHL